MQLTTVYNQNLITPCISPFYKFFKHVLFKINWVEYLFMTDMSEVKSRCPKWSRFDFY